ncbi:hypothetical protein D9758_009523 [Tetrapyrgos nigripes]|uniref:Uncharacterized protein n=1 Tax=Tetrapyrgos nigripes TaxID=182062 RepID=A0A8H5G178_9AGAR|nr:hypothetical protein D9758_009523 [Tetrapyrgos nigripes]
MPVTLVDLLLGSTTLILLLPSPVMAFQQLLHRFDTSANQALLNIVNGIEAGTSSNETHNFHPTTQESNEVSSSSDSIIDGHLPASDNHFASSSSALTLVHSSADAGGSGTVQFSDPILSEVGVVAGPADKFDKSYQEAVGWHVVGLAASMFMAQKMYGKQISLGDYNDFIQTCQATILQSLSLARATNQHILLTLLYVDRVLPDTILEVFSHLDLEGKREVELVAFNQVQLGLLMARVYILCLKMAMEFYDDECPRDLRVWQDLLFMYEPIIHKSVRQLELLFDDNLWIRNDRWLGWLTYIRGFLGHPYAKYHPRAFQYFDAILCGCLHRLGPNASVSASCTDRFIWRIDIHTPLRYKQQERLLLFLTCGLPAPDSKGLPQYTLDCAGYGAGVVVGIDVPDDMEWVEQELSPDEEPQSDFVDESHRVMYEAEDVEEDEDDLYWESESDEEEEDSEDDDVFFEPLNEVHIPQLLAGSSCA